jgi:hypothetical protein
LTDNSLELGVIESYDVVAVTGDFPFVTSKVDYPHPKKSAWVADGKFSLQFVDSAQLDRFSHMRIAQKYEFVLRFQNPETYSIGEGKYRFEVARFTNASGEIDFDENSGTWSYYDEGTDQTPKYLSGFCHNSPRTEKEMDYRRLFPSLSVRENVWLLNPAVNKRPLLGKQ